MENFKKSDDDAQFPTLAFEILIEIRILRRIHSKAALVF